MDNGMNFDQQYALQEQFLDILADFIQAPPETFKTLMERAIAKIYDEKVLSHFILYIFYLSDRLTTNHALKGFKDNEQEYYTKVLFIEQYLPECLGNLDKKPVYDQAVDYYAKVVSNA